MLGRDGRSGPGDHSAQAIHDMVGVDVVPAAFFHHDQTYGCAGHDVPSTVGSQMTSGLSLAQSTRSVDADTTGGSVSSEVVSLARATNSPGRIVPDSSGTIAKLPYAVPCGARLDAALDHPAPPISSDTSPEPITFTRVGPHFADSPAGWCWSGSGGESLCRKT